VPDWLTDLFARYGYAVVFIGVFLENTGLPVPGETALLAGAAMAQYGWLSLPRVILIAIAAATLGDNLGFFVGRRLGRGLAERYGSRVGLTAKRLAQFDRFFHRYGGRTVFIARFITGLRVFGALLAGTSGLRWPTFLFYNALGAISWCIVIACAGYSLAYSWDTLEHWVGRGGLIAAAIAATIALVSYLRARRAETS
jgi:membrane protein DedA with SNARE-associated domain